MRRKIPRGRACFFCGTRLARLRQHHLTPVLRGGDHSRNNLVDSCCRCSRSKGMMTVSEFRQLVAMVLRQNRSQSDYAQFYGEGGRPFTWPTRYLPRVGNRGTNRLRLDRAPSSVAGHIPCRWCDAWLPPRELARHQPRCPRRPRNRA